MSCAKFRTADCDKLSLSWASSSRCEFNKLNQKFTVRQTFLGEASSRLRNDERQSSFLRCDMYRLRSAGGAAHGPAAQQTGERAMHKYLALALASTVAL